MTADDIRARLDAIEAYCAAATEGPWWRREGYAEIDGQNYAEVLMPGPVNCGSYCYGGLSTIDGDRLDADLAFIARARTDLPAVVAALRDALAECSCTPYHAGGDGPEEDCPAHGRSYSEWVEQRDALAVENARLKAWKAEALALLAAWEDVYVALNSPGPLGASKAAAALGAVSRLHAAVDEAEEETDRLRAQVQAVEALLDNRDHGGDCHSWDKFRSVDGPHPCDCWRADLLAALIAPEHVISKPEPGDPLPSRCTCGWIGTDGAVEIHFIRNLRAALATTEAGEES